MTPFWIKCMLGTHKVKPPLTHGWVNFTTKMKTLYEKIGGEAAVDAAVEKFYGKGLMLLKNEMPISPNNVKLFLASFSKLSI